MQSGALDKDEKKTCLNEEADKTNKNQITLHLHYVLVRPFYLMNNFKLTTPKIPHKQNTDIQFPQEFQF